MGDIADITQDREESLNKAREDAKKRFKPAISECCYECGSYIPMARQEAVGGTDMCVDCQADYERGRKAFL